MRNALSYRINDKGPKRVVELVMVFMLISTAQLLLGQEKVTLQGVVISKETNDAVPYVHIFTKDGSRGTVTNENGEFRISADLYDTLVFSSVGYEHYFFRLTENVSDGATVVIELDTKTYELDPVNVQAYKSIETFKQDVLALDIPTEKKGIRLEIPKGYTLPPEGARDMSQAQGGATIRGAVSGLYDAFSREGRERKKLATYRKDQHHQRVIADRYNADIVKRVTNLSDEAVEQFMEWCKFEDDFILNSSDYELSVAMLKCLDEFKSRDK